MRVREILSDACVGELASACVPATAWIQEILYSLRMMQRAEAGMPNEAASVIRVAVNRFRTEYKRESRLDLTNITPDWCLIQGVVGPYDRVHKLVKTSERGPHHVVACSRVPRFQVPW